MSFYSVDEKKCCGDGACAAVCPVEILQLDSNRVPRMIEGGEKLCIHCGHCVAVCPTAALSLSFMPAEQCEDLDADWHLSLSQVSRLLKGRRSIRVFKDQSVDPKITEQLIDVARYAPSGINIQPVRWAVVDSPKAVQHIADLVVLWIKEQVAADSPMAKAFNLERIVARRSQGRDLICRFAPQLVVAYGLSEDRTAPQAATIALTYLELAAAAQGLGACWAGYVHLAALQNEAVKKSMGIRSRETCLGAMLLGHPKYVYHRVPLRNPALIKWLEG